MHVGCNLLCPCEVGGTSGTKSQAATMVNGYSRTVMRPFKSSGVSSLDPFT